MNQTTERKPKKVPTSGVRPKKRNRRLKQEIRQRKQQEQQRRELRRGYVVLGLLAVLVLLFFLNFRTRQVDGVSMVPTLADNDRLLVRRTEAFARYELITFEPADKAGESYVKRIIGLPGDRLHLDGNRLYLYEATTKQQTNSQAGTFSAEQLPDGALTVLLSPEAVQSIGTQTEIPANQYFVLGDNRSNSRDSREMGLITSDQIEGVVVFRYFPLTSIGRVS
ncbi:signal peptidase I [Enterococcus sp. BWR-S5]|uniref:signal peptidase I n=1 Tax=Enterococcus sp. BWR-S5 TaxID=2787714 RepID=UPI001923878F|nr:signal peptidase I [Enterococcus sp. BWR-S5]MBL1225165.1 signal peptidase I [Enterococcus sp. BWR-S5]